MLPLLFFSANSYEQLETLIPGDKPYVHDRIDSNAHSHLRAVLLGMSETIPVEDGHPVLGTWQSIFFAELDGPRTRKVNVKIIGSRD
ncbi:MAG: secondary thiamine-phosphate synthase enzyme YjbQ [Candidatus Methanoperedens sp.]|nr:secondary thiamine-phosphate synthase enzyme YjbQ [Candidatus Methanoperedens sp.]